MGMNIHPAFVHFPIALLFLYTIIELVPLRNLMPSMQWEPIKRFLLYVGTIAAGFALVTGTMAEDAVGETSALEPHETAAWILLSIFVLVSVLTFYWTSETPIRGWTMKALALAGLITLFIVGALGANIVYGSNVDPIVRLVTQMIGLQ